jgi:hypothetical protein
MPGSKIQSVGVDLWGWRARVRLARGQTIADVTVRVAAIESALGTYRGAVRIYPTGDGKANRRELRVLNTDRTEGHISVHIGRTVRRVLLGLGTDGDRGILCEPLKAGRAMFRRFWRAPTGGMCGRTSGRACVRSADFRLGRSAGTRPWRRH